MGLGVPANNHLSEDLWIVCAILGSRSPSPAGREQLVFAALILLLLPIIMILILILIISKITSLLGSLFFLQYQCCI